MFDILVDKKKMSNQMMLQDKKERKRKVKEKILSQTYVAYGMKR